MINQEYIKCTEYTLSSLNHVFYLMKIDTPTHKRYYDNEIDYHFKLKTEILWAWSVNFNNFIENVHKKY